MKNLINPWVIMGAILVASILLLLTFLASGSIFSAFETEYYGEGVITVIPIPTYTPIPTPTATPLSSTATIDVESGIQVGSYVKVAGTEGDGLRLRAEPSLQGEIKYLGIEDEIFLVEEGPQDQDGYLWWYLVTPLNKTKNGWAVSNYLLQVQNP
jgi:hypothetical protein